MEWFHPMARNQFKKKRFSGPRRCMFNGPSGDLSENIPSGSRQQKLSVTREIPTWCPLDGQLSWWSWLQYMYPTVSVVGFINQAITFGVPPICFVDFKPQLIKIKLSHTISSSMFHIMSYSSSTVQLLLTHRKSIKRVVCCLNIIKHSCGTSDRFDGGYIYVYVCVCPYIPLYLYNYVYFYTQNSVYLHIYIFTHVNLMSPFF